MQITQQDIASLSDHEVKRLAVIADDLAAIGGPLSPFWTAFTRAAVHAMRERSSALAWFEFDLMNDDGPGAIVPEERS